MVVTGGFVPSLGDAGKDPAHDVDAGEERLGDRAVERTFAGAQAREQVFAGVRDPLKSMEAEERACALDRVQGAERAGQQRRRARIGLQPDQILVETVQAFLAVGEELVDDRVILRTHGNATPHA